jgi:methanethiol oxidase
LDIHSFFKHADENVWAVEKVIDVPPIKISGWKNAPPASFQHSEKADLADQTVFGMMTDIILSLDDRFLYFSNWLHGDVRQYDVTDPKHPKLVGQVYLGGVLANDVDNSITCDSSVHRPIPVFINGRRLFGGPQMVGQLID